ncbi:hypothetical protein Pfo_004403 [Paulownia fortunei]|nr:hypothetical protein Pfo_004403 [Paulownia fortunei]
MTTIEIPHVHSECGRRSSPDVGSATSEEEEEGSVCFSDADEGSSNSRFYSNADGFGIYESSAADPSDCTVDIESGGIGEKKVHLGRVERGCRICHLSLLSSIPGSGFAIELGCCCKDDLAAAHKHCAEFVVFNFAAQQASESSVVASTSATPWTTETRSCLNGHPFLNFLLACMVFAFLISWLFHIQYTNV